MEKTMSSGTIVPQSDVIVKGAVENQPRTNRIKWTEHKRQSVATAEKMRVAGMDERRIERMLHCGEYIEFDRCADCGTYSVAKTSLCRDRLCPLCSWRLALKRYAEMSRLMEALTTAYPECYYSLITLTVQNCDLRSLRDTMRKMQECWHKLLSRKDYKAYCLGTGRSVEITRNEQDGTYHPHYHVITMWMDDKQTSAPAMAARLVRNWIELAEKAGLTVSSAAQNAQTIQDSADAGQSMIGAVLETYKYAIKPSDVMDIPASELRTFAAQISGVRFVSFTGKIKEYARRCEVDVDTVDDTVGDTIVCAHCRSKNIDRLIYKWSFGERRYILSSPEDYDQTALRADLDDEYRARLEAIYARGDR